MIYIEEEEEEDMVPVNENGAYFAQYISNRRPITEEEKRQTVALASAELDSEGFMIVMRPTNVYRRFYLVNYKPFSYSPLLAGVCVFYVNA